MAKEFARKLYNSRAWKKCKESYTSSVYGLCQRCGKPGDIVHHKILLTPMNIDDPYITLNHNNLELLCIDCHNKEHMSNHEKIIRDGLMFDAKGDLVHSPHSD